MYAVIQHGGHQYKIRIGQEFEIDKISVEEGQTVNIDKVLLLVDGPIVKIGEPFIPETYATLKILKQIRGKKIRVLRFKAKSRYQKVTGFRFCLYRARVLAIKSESKKYD